MKLQLQSSLLKADGQDIAETGICEQQQAAIFVGTSDDTCNGNMKLTACLSVLR